MIQKLTTLQFKKPLKKCFYIGALGSKNTHKNRCERLKENGFKDDEIQKIFGPIGIRKFGGRSAPEIDLTQ